MADSPAVSVVVPTYNRVKVLPRTLQAALLQEGVEFEVVIVDDHSSDGTWAYLQSLGDPRVRPVRTERNEGVSRARNRGIAEARGEWIAFLDDDDAWAPTKLAAQLARARLDGADFIYCHYVVLDDECRVIGLEGTVSPRDLFRRLLGYNAIGSPSSVMASRALIERTGGFDDRLAYLADWELWIRFAKAGTSAIAPEFLVGYVHHPDNMLLQKRYDISGELEYMGARHPELDVDPVGWGRWLAGGPRRAGRRLQAARIYLRGAIEFRNAGNVVRAIGVLLGERAMRVGASLFEEPKFYEPEWVKDYRGPMTPSRPEDHRIDDACD